MGFMNQEKFLTNYTYEVGQDFGIEGRPASWAGSENLAHRFWDDEDDSTKIPINATGPMSTSITGISHDEKFIAISSGLAVVVFDLETQKVCTEFKGLTARCANLNFSPVHSESGGYTLVVGDSDLGEQQQIILFLNLDKSGRWTDEPEDLDWGLLLELSLEPVRSEMDAVYGRGSTRQLMKPVREDYKIILQKLQSNIKSKDLIRVNGLIGHFGSKPFSADGRFLLYLVHNQSTQQGMRPPEELPHVVVYDIVNHTEKHVLGGHQDAIMWTDFSPDGQYVATASWDGTFRIFEVDSGDCKHVIGPTGGQCWTGAWSPDSKDILLCGMAHQDGEGRPEVFVAVYSVEKAQQINRFDHTRLNDWVRNVAWSETGAIAFAHKTEVFVWEPFENRVISTFALKVESFMLRGFAGVRDVEWVQEGDVLIAYTGDGTIEVWNWRQNAKWRVQRPHGLVQSRRAWWMEKQKAIVSVDGEGIMRFYRL
ncbi:WD40 repeat-like protein [Aureobasidium pullulans]|nr:WD40 repeat-like protein [Aureobasidium pullulans]